MTIFRTLFIFFILFCLSCATARHETGFSEISGTKTDRGLYYTCRLENGDIIVTTDSAVAGSESAKKADVFIEKTRYMPIDITGLNVNQDASAKKELQYLEEVVVKKLTRETREWGIGTTGTLFLEAEAQTDLPAEERTIQLVRVKTHPKVTCYAENIFSRLTGSELAVAAPVHLHFGVKGTVTSIGEDGVRVDFEPESEQAIDGPFGPVIVHDKGDHYRIEVDAQEGHLVRVGPAIGRIAQVTDKNFTVDYSHPFGGQPLVCDVRVAAIQEQGALPAQTAQKETKDVAPGGETTVTDGEPKTPLPPHILQKTVQKGDLVTVACTAFLESGEMVWTTRSDYAQDPKLKKIDGYQAQETFAPEIILAGGVESFPGLAESVVGMRVGERKKVTLEAGKAFGNRNPQLMRQFDRTKIIPTRVTMQAQAYVKQFGGFPINDNTVPFNPYTIARVVEVDEQGAVLEISPVKPEIDDEFGLTRMQIIDGKIHIHLTPKLGSNFELEKRHGKVVAIDERQFTVDFNGPLAGENIVMDVQVIALRKSSAFAGKDIDWIEDYDVGLAFAEQYNKPAVLVLYADWCGYSKKLFNQTLVDPRIKMIRDDFIWIKIDSDQEQAFKTLYDQKSFPLTVVLNSLGDVIGSINGFRPANEFRIELLKAIDGVDENSDLKAGIHTKEEI